MKRKKLPLLILTLSAVFLCKIASAQLYINNAQFFIQSGATVTVQGNLTSNVNIQGSGLVVLNGTAAQTVDMGGNIIPNLQVNNTSNVTLLSNAKVDTSLTFTAGNILTGNNNLTIGHSGTITGASTTSFVVTNGTGSLIKDTLSTTAFTYPVGYATTNYLPVTISNSGTADNISVNSFDHVYSGGTTGTAFTKEVVDASWNIGEAVAGGSNLSITADWAPADTLAGFNKTKSGISYYITTPAANVGWDLLNSETSTAVGPIAGLYSYTRTGVTSLGTFAVGFRPVLSPLLISSKVFLQGAFNTTTGVMNDELNAVLPTTEPYSAMTNYTQLGSGGGETAASSLLTTTGTNTSVVDWVFVSLYSSSDSVVVSTRSALILVDGSIVETDGVSPLSMGGNAPGTYYISVRHRNHLGVRTSGTLTLAKITTTAYNFTTGLAQAYKGTVTNNAMATMISGANTIYCMWGGDANGNKVVRYSGPANDESQLLNTTLGGNKGATVSGYNNSDLNMNGSVRYSGPSNDESELLNTILGGNKSTIINQPSF